MKWMHSFVRFVLHIFWLIPIKKGRVVFTAYKGKQFSCNPKYIFKELYDKHQNDFEFFWCLYDAEQLPTQYKGIKTAPYKSLKYIYYQITAQVVVLNHANPVYIPLRKKQLKINTWHGGGAYKRVSLSANDDKCKLEKYKAQCEVKDTDVFLSSSKRFTEVMLESQMLPSSAYFNTGMPRNDLFFKNNDQLIINIKETLGISVDEKIVLYAPTYRGAQGEEGLDMQLDVVLLVNSLKERFGGEWTLLLRTHISTINTTTVNELNLLDVTSYPDMQELLLIADVLITDYSSSIWDFAYTKKPAFLFTPDLQNYIDNRGFYVPIDHWQYPYAQTNNDLANLILSFDEKKNIERIENYIVEMGSYETGDAAINVCNLICDKLENKGY